jgi:hypothetical protein
MTIKTILVALTFLVGATSFTLAQSQPNRGPNGPAKSDCFGAPYSGAAGAKCSRHSY